MSDATTRDAGGHPVQVGPIRPLSGRSRIPAALVDVRFQGWPGFTVSLSARRGGVAVVLPVDAAGEEAVRLPAPARAALHDALAAALHGDARAQQHLHRPGTPAKLLAPKARQGRAAA